MLHLLHVSKKDFVTETLVLASKFMFNTGTIKCVHIELELYSDNTKVEFK